MDLIISLGQKKTLAEYMILFCADNRPPMLDKDLTKKYAELSTVEKIQADCYMKATNIILQGLPADIYSLVNHHRVAKDLWERSKFMTDVKLVKDLQTSNYDQIHTYLEQHELHANEVRLMHKSNQDPLAFVANQQMTPPHFNTYQSSYNNPLLQQKFSPSQQGSIQPHQHYSSHYPSQTQFNHSSIPPSHSFQSHMNHQTLTVPQVSYQSPQAPTQLMTESLFVDSSFAVLVFSPRDDSIACLYKAMAFLTVIGEGHMARQCTQPKRQRNVAWYKEKAMLAEAQEAGQIMDEEQLAFLADLGIPAGQVQTIIPHNAAFQTKDLNTYDSDCDDLSNAQASSYNNPQLQQQFSPSQQGSIQPHQHYSSHYPSQTQFNRSSIPPSHSFQSHMNHQTLTVPQVSYQSPQAPTQLMTESLFVDLGIAVLVFSPRDDSIACLYKAMAFLIVVGEGHMARQCTQPKRERNAAWYKEKAMLAEAQEGGQIMDEEKLAFLADPGIPAGQVQTIIPHNAAFQTEDLNTYDSDCDDLSNAQAVLMTNISNYGSDVISEEKANKEQNQELIVAELERYKERVKTFKQRLNIDLSSREKMIYSQMDDMIKEKLALKEKVDSLEENLSKQITEKGCLLETFNVFKNKSKEKENKYKKTEIDLEQKIKELNNIVFKVGQSAQTVHMLTKPQSFYDNVHKQALVEQAKAKQPLDNELDFACKHAIRIQELLVNVQDTCPSAIRLSEIKVARTPMNKIKKVTFAEPTATSSTNQETHDSNKPMLHSTGVKCSTSASGSKPSGNTKNNRISQPSSSNKINKLEDQPRSVKTRKNNIKSC
nr:hypothetical protein [Tanacetum cinerariifolium]